MPKPNPNQAMLFGDSAAARVHDIVGPAPSDAEMVKLASQLPPNLYLGTSSWSFPGWRGLVWDRAVSTENLARFGLAVYAAHPLFHTVGLDRTFYAPMSEPELADLAAAVPPRFRFLVKAHQVCTRPGADDRGSTFGQTSTHTQANPEFLRADYAVAKVIAPSILGLAHNCGPIVFQFPPLDLSRNSLTGGADALLDKLDTFLSELPKGPVGPHNITPLYAVEVRNAELMSARFTEMASQHGIAFALASHPSVPPLSAQRILLQAEPRQLRQNAPDNSPQARAAFRGGLVVRWLLNHSQNYQSAKASYEPFDKLAAEDRPARQAIAEIVVDAIAAGLPVWVVVNNKAEGSAPRSIFKLAQEVVSRLARGTAAQRGGALGDAGADGADGADDDASRP